MLRVITWFNDLTLLASWHWVPVFLSFSPVRVAHSYLQQYIARSETYHSSVICMGSMHKTQPNTTHSFMSIEHALKQVMQCTRSGLTILSKHASNEHIKHQVLQNCFNAWIQTDIPTGMTLSLSYAQRTREIEREQVGWVITIIARNECRHVH